MLELQYQVIHFLNPIAIERRLVALILYGLPWWQLVVLKAVVFEARLLVRVGSLPALGAPAAPPIGLLGQATKAIVS